MNLKILIFILATSTITLLSNCRSANQLLNRAILKGASIDSTVVIVNDSVFVNVAEGGPVMDYTFMEAGVNVDTVVVREICEELTAGLHAKKSVKKLQDKICPQVDSVYNVVVDVQGKLYNFPIKVTLSGGSYKLQTYKMKIPYVKEETNLHLSAPRGITRLNALYLALGCVAAGVIAGFFIAVRNRK